MKAADFMTAPVFATRPESAIRDAARMLVANHISSLPVTNRQHELVGIVTESELFRATALGHGASRGGVGVPDLPRLVREVMRRDPLWVRSSDTVELCLQLMMRRRGRSLPVLHHGRVAGIITRRDLLAAMVGPTGQVIDHMSRATAGTCEIDLSGYDREGALL